MQITHCPQCETAFKVSPQQLDAAKGWVRCGRCAHVFEAHLYFEDPTPSITPPPVDASAPELFRAAVNHSLTTQTGQDENKPSDSITSPHDVDQPNVLTAIGLVLLSVLLVGQWLVWQRHWLAAEEPALRPVLSFMCGGCEVTWPREPEAVLIESSSFTENPAGGYTVQLRLKNTQHHAVAMPALELNLTDFQDQVLIRRVFTAQELAARDHLQALRDARVTLNFDINESVAKRISGFRALVFYP